jgi:hypothetical protein
VYLSFLNNPYAVFPLLLVLSLADIMLGYVARKGRETYIQPIFMYETTISIPGKKSFRKITIPIGTKLMAIALLFILWNHTVASAPPFSSRPYRFLLGFMLSIFLIIDLRHLETIFIARTIKSSRNDLEGKLLIKRGYSLRQSAIQLFTIFIILTGIFILNWDLFYFGVALAPLALIIRNLALLKS